MRRAHVHVSGLVQGVGFRWYATRRARELGLSGWVRNLPDGRVEAVFEGEDEAVDTMVAWCGRGPSGARVERVEVADEPPEGLRGFGS
jgi:acylphosphatase